MIKLAFTGNPNVGKSALMEAIVGSKLKVGNWPGVTVEKKEAVFNHKGEEIKLVDLPGVYSLSPYTLEEKITRDFILDENPDVVINVIDSTNLERNLYLTYLLKELEKPTVMALNFYDEFTKLNYKLNLEEFQELIELKAIPVSALKGTGIEELLDSIIELAAKKEKVKKILEKLHEKFGDPKCALDFKTPFELLVAVILSAQCTDVRVNIVTKEMYKKVNTPEGFAALPVEKIEEMIKSTGFFRNKAKNIKLCSQQLLSKYNGEIPKDMDKLIELAGVGRKTANVVRGEVWGLADGITVDTHVKRLSNLIGLVKNDDPVKIEQELMKIVPKKDWIDFSHYLILQGRDKCIARRPKCNECEIKELCNHGKNIDK